MSVKKFFVSRFPDGFLIEADYSQLEIRVLAELSRDPTLITDLKLGVDLHKQRAADWLRIPLSEVTSEQRRLAKQISFQLQYGAGYKSIAEKNNITVQEAQQFVEAYYRRYPGVAAWQEDRVQEVVRSRVMTPRHTPRGFPVGKGYVVCPYTKRRYVFFEKDSTWKTEPSFYLPEIKNYPVQGLATGVIVPLILGKIQRNMWSMGLESLLVNTVHDSIVVDTPSSELHVTGRILKNTMEMAPVYIEQQFGKNWSVPLPADLKYGSNWEDMNPLEI